MTAALVTPVALFFLSFSVWALVAPVPFARIVGLDADTPMGRNEVRAVYGGFGLAMVALCAGALLAWPEFRAGLFLALALALGGMAGGRVVAALVSGAVPRMGAIAFVSEVACAVLLLAALRQTVGG
jgi:predicted anti-sigma-YlaC factor YlaD